MWRSLLCLIFFCCSISITQAAGLIDSWEKGGRQFAVTVPEYPKELLEKGQQAAVAFEFSLDLEGGPTRLTFLEPRVEKPFESAVLAALAKWRYLPNKDQLCGVGNDRMRQVIWFDIVNGEPKVTMSKVVDIIKKKPQPSAEPTDTFIREISKETGEEQLVPLAKAKQLQRKKGTIKRPHYPWQSIKKAQEGLVVAMIDVKPDGAVDKTYITYSAPDKRFGDSVSKVIPDWQFETIDGDPPGRPYRICQFFTFAQPKP